MTKGGLTVGSGEHLATRIGWNDPQAAFPTPRPEKAKRQGT